MEDITILLVAPHIQVHKYKEVIKVKEQMIKLYLKEDGDNQQLKITNNKLLQIKLH
jgi:hypothetical protein